MKRILYIQYTNPAAYPPLEHSSRILAEHEWEVLFLGTGSWGTSSNLEFLSHSNISVRLLPFVASGWQQKVHYFFYVFWILWNTLVWRPKWVYASDLWATPIGWILTFVPGIKVLYHEHDAPGPPTNMVIKWILVAREWLARRAALIVIPNQQRSEVFKRETRTTRPIYIVWNCPRRDEVTLPKRNAVKSNLRILYQGSVVPERLPTTFVKALTQIPSSVELHVIGYETIGSVGYIAQLQDIAQQDGVVDRCYVHGPMSRHELMQKISAYDVGLSFMPTNSNDLNMTAMVGASNKIFDYMAGGLAVLVNDSPEWNNLFVRPEYGRSCQPDNIESIAIALQWYLDHQDEMHKMGEQGRRKISSEWNYDSLFQPVLQILMNP